MRQEEYLQILTEQIRSKKARGAVSEEIRGHIEEQKAEFMSEGMERREAEEAAVSQARRTALAAADNLMGRFQKKGRWEIRWQQGMSWTEYTGLRWPGG